MSPSQQAQLELEITSPGMVEKYLCLRHREGLKDRLKIHKTQFELVSQN